MLVVSIEIVQRQLNKKSKAKGKQPTAKNKLKVMSEKTSNQQLVTSN
ncbi:hypothetical protein KORDIASMS9_02025 [Kordia sp. SMS9]|nr:hypothetical protein KORDIASMS9_02025 [Kordia sp. SMS9]